MSIRIGVAGCGKHALARIIPLLQTSKDLDLVALWTREPLAHAGLKECGVKAVHDDFHDFLAVDMDVVYVASVTGCHFAHAAEALRSGRHVWVEKPLVSSLSDAHELVRLAAQSGRMLAECFMFTWHEQARAIRETLAQGLLGEQRMVSLAFGFPHLRADDFRYDPVLGGGAWLDHGCYLVKAIDCYFPGDWTLLGGCMEREDRIVDVRGSALLRRSADGMIAQLHWGFGQSYVNELQVLGTEGRMRVASAFTKPAARSCSIMLETSMGQCTTVPIDNGNAYAAMLAGFCRQLANPASWAGMRQEILVQAEHLFRLQELLEHPVRHFAAKALPHAE